MAYPKMAERAAEKQGTVTTKQLKGALKAGGKMAAEELLMSVIPVARIGKLAKLIKGLGKGKKTPKKGELKSMLEERGFKKLASVDPTLNELEVFLKKRAPKGMEDEIIRVSGRAPSTDRIKGAYKSLPRMRREAKALGKDLEPGQLELEHGSNLISAGRKEGSEALKSHGRAAIRKSDRKKALSKMVRKAAEAKAKRLDSFKGLTGHSRFSMGAGAKKLDAIPGVKYIDARDAGPEARNTLAFLKDHKGSADFRLVKQNGKTKVMAVEVEGIHSVGGKAGTKEVHIFDLGEKNAKRFLGY